MGKGRKGRPRASGKRTRSGRLIPLDPEARRVKGSEQAERRKELFGDNGYDAIGRAYAVGLLGEGDQAKDRLAIGRRYAQAYHAEWSIGRYRCALDSSPRGASNYEGTNERREWIMAQTARVVATGTMPFFDQLVDPLRMHTDANPEWLGRMIATELANRVTRGVLELHDERDWIILRAALKGLDALCGNPAASERAQIERLAA